MNNEKIKARVTTLINEANTKIKEATKENNNELRHYYEGSLYNAKMVAYAMDCDILYKDGKAYLKENKTTWPKSSWGKE